MKFIGIALIIIGEFTAIYGEMLGARTQGGAFSRESVPVYIIAIIGTAMLISGYMTGYAAFKNIWIVSVVSITAILIIEPILAYTMFHELPTKGALIGLILGSAGFAATLIL